MALAAVLMGQIALSILNVMLLAPVWLQIVHLCVAELFWVLVVLDSANLLFPAYRRRNKGVNAVNDCPESTAVAMIS